jgi:hypothetical protein
MFMMHRPYRFVIILYVFLVYIYSCNHGLKPTEPQQSEKSGISGTIFYTNWPPADSLIDLRLVVFKIYPPENIFEEISAGRAFVYPAIGPENLPFYVDSTKYVMELDPGYYEYVAVAQRYGSDLFTDWLAVGQYDTLFSDELPTSISVISGELLEDINIEVDFDSLPPQPF